MLNERQIRAIEMLVTGDYTKTEIAKEVNVSRPTLYSWIENSEFSAEVSKQLQNIKHQAAKDFTSKLPKAIQEYWKICNSSTDARTKEKALQYWIDRSLGRIANTVNVNEGSVDSADFDIDSFLDNYDKDSEQETEE